MDWEPGEGADAGGFEQDERHRLEAAQQLLERNAEAVFKLNGLAMLRRQSGGPAALAPSAEEQQLLAEAQRCLQEVAAVLPPKVLMQPEVAQRYQQQLRAQEEAAAAAGVGLPAGDAAVGMDVAAAAAGAAGGSRKRKHLHDKQERLRQQQLLLQQQQQQQGGGAAVEAQQQLLWQQQGGGGGSSGQPPLLAPGQLQQTPAASQGSMSGLLHPGSSAGGVSSMLHVGGAAGPRMAPTVFRSNASGLFQSGSDAGLGGGAQAPPVVDPVAKEEMWLLSQAYSSMTTEQKEKLAAQPPDVRNYVLRERMRKTKEQLELLQRERAAATVNSLLAQTAQQPAAPAAQWLSGGGDGAAGAEQQAVGTGIWPLRPGGQQGGGAQQPAAGAAGAGTGPAGQEGAMQQDASLLGLINSNALEMPPAPLGPSQPTAPLDRHQPQQLLTGQRPREGPTTLVPVQLLQPATLVPPGRPSSPSDVRSAPRELGASLPTHPSAPFAAMSEAERLEHLRSLKRRQEEWLEQQRRQAAAMLAGHSGS